MKTIWEFRLEYPGVSTVNMPRNARVLTAQSRAGRVVIWAIVDDGAPMERRVFAAVTTGCWAVDIDHWAYVATVQMATELALHVFEVLPTAEGSPQ